MRSRSRISFPLLPRYIFGIASICLVSGLELLAADKPAGQTKSTREELSLGREIFLREWVPNDPRSHGGDGLGPVFNDSSCVACHNLGGTGGGGPVSKNVDIITAAPANVAPENVKQKKSQNDEVADSLAMAMRLVNGFRILAGAPMISVVPEPKSVKPINVDEPSKLHPGFRTARSIVLHRFGTEHEFEKWHPMSAFFREALRDVSAPHPKPARDSAPYEVWRQGDNAVDLWLIAQKVGRAVEEIIDVVRTPFMPNEALTGFGTEFGLNPQALPARTLPNVGPRRNLLTMVVNDDKANGFGSAEENANALLVASQRNPTALFGAGLIDTIPDSVIEEAARTKHRDFPFVTGRVSRLRDGRIGKFGWKGQTASLRDFTLTACAVELGLNVPGHEQAVVPYKPEYRSPGLDLTENECDALVAYLASLPAPTRTRGANADYAAYLVVGEKLFAETGCSACHIRKLGDVDGIYSDLLLHDMGPALADSGIYGTTLPEDPDENDVAPTAELAALTSATDESQQAPVNGDAATKPKSRSPRRSEWRTPPLWGVRDSGPYLHDGGAETIPDAIAMHGGEALPSTNKYFKLPHEQRQQLISFLKSLTAP